MDCEHKKRFSEKCPRDILEKENDNTLAKQCFFFFFFFPAGPFPPNNNKVFLFIFLSFSHFLSPQKQFPPQNYISRKKNTVAKWLHTCIPVYYETEEEQQQALPPPPSPTHSLPHYHKFYVIVWGLHSIIRWNYSHPFSSIVFFLVPADGKYWRFFSKLCATPAIAMNKTQCQQNEYRRTGFKCIV